MTLPVRALNVLQRWDCHGCSDCCRAPASVALDADDLQRLSEQRWESHPDLAGVRIVVGRGWRRRGRWLAQRGDGRCVFLTDDQRCLIHREHGEAAKPLACRVFPFRLTPVNDHLRLSVRLHCPSAAAGRGRPLSDHLSTVRTWSGRVAHSIETVAPPPLIGSQRRGWRETRLVTDALDRIAGDPALPPVRRLVIGLRFCALLAAERLDRVDAGALKKLVKRVEESAPTQVGESFRARTPPGGPGGFLFRQAAAEYLRPHAGLMNRPSLSVRWRRLRAGWVIARGRGLLPSFRTDWPAAAFDDLEQPLGLLEPAILAPLRGFLESALASMSYCGVARAGWSVVDGFRALALTFAVSMWALRWRSYGRAPEPADMVAVVGLVDRSHHYPLLCGARHRRRLALLSVTGDLERLLVWYAR